MASFNRVIMVGNLCADPELKTTPTGKTVVGVSIAVTRPKSQNNPNPITDFFEIQAWASVAEFIARFFIKGKPILVEGQLQNHSWTDNNGNKKVKSIIKVERATFCENKDSALNNYNSPISQASIPQSPTYSPDGDNFEELSASDDLPF